MISRFQKIYHEFPRKFWLVVLVGFVDRVGGTLLFPFLSLYITGHFNVGMTQAGLVLGIFSISSLAGNVVGGALADHFGRRKLILFGLVFSALSTLSLGLVNQFSVLVLLAVVIGLLSDVAGPAHQAMIADILPEHKRQEGFGILRVVANLAWIIGPTIGGFIADRNFFLLFVIDVVISLIVAVMFYFLIAETKPEPKAGEPRESMLATFKGYGAVLRDGAYMAFLLAGILMGLVYQQMYNSLSVYLRDVHGIQPQGYGFLMTASAITVILFQFWVTRKIKSKAPFLLMAFGTLFYMLGFSMFGFVTAYWLFVSAVVIITMGEMIIMPSMQALAANFAPAEMRGRYMAVFSLMWTLPATIGPGAAGVILDNYNPNLLWYVGGGLCAVSALGFYFLHLRLGSQARFAPTVVEAGADD
ncbi:arabinose efflux permease [Longilinea arvoryzae]|uniref:Arabinose efflux permease n=1 Tax=Longilinea arvoryzae TaxID=360412 RepID=A0A0S7BDC1_9CHLR|nr:MFS transporter [Longilinea arvoryzae]GAP13321.1 arabinose efflux permease [Longilinea arvoryzae]